MITTIITGVIALVVGLLIGYMLINMTLKYRSKNIIKEAEAEAEVIKKDKILQAKRNSCKQGRTREAGKCPEQQNSSRGK